MRTRFNEDLLLWSIATLQPASIGDALAFLTEIFPDVKPLPRVKDLEPLIEEWVDEGYILRVHGKSRLYSTTSRCNQKLGIPLRRHRDKTRLFLLKDVRNASLRASRVAQQDMAGASPAEVSSIGTQEGSRPISSDATPRRPRSHVRTYWTRVIKQLDFRVGSAPRSPDTYFEYYSFPTVAAIHEASDKSGEVGDLSISDLGLAIGVSPRLLTSFTHKPERHYRQFEIGKRSGGKRVISSPKTFLKVVQYWLLDYALFDLPVHDNCHSYRPHRSILTNATPHVGKRFVGGIDVEDFFGSINKKMLVKFLTDQGIGRLFANTIAGLTTLNDGLPQGAPTSPLLSNAFLYCFDYEMAQFAEKHELEYTRYADDITLSGDDAALIHESIKLAFVLLKDIGLKLNEKKTRISSRSGQQKVTGVVVNEKPQPSREMRRRIRAMFHQAEIRTDEFASRLPELRGYMNYLQSYPVLRDSPELEKYHKILIKLKNV